MMGCGRYDASDGVGGSRERFSQHARNEHVVRARNGNH